MFVAYILALIAGICPPVMILIFAKLVDKFVTVVVIRRAGTVKMPRNLNKFIAMKW